MNTTSSTLLVRLRHAQDNEAWTRLSKLYTPLIFYWARRLGFSEHDAEDLVQELMADLLVKIHHFERRGEGSFRAWLRAVATNKCRERLRRLQPLTADSQPPDAIADAIEKDSFWEREYQDYIVARALAIMQADFEPTTWQACWQRVVEDLPAAEVAERLKISESAVYVYTGRVLRRLREELAELLD